MTFLLGVLKLADMYWPAFISQYAHNMRLVYVGLTITFVWSVHLLNLLVYDIIDWWNLLPQYKIVRVIFRPYFSITCLGTIGNSGDLNFSEPYSSMS